MKKHIRIIAIALLSIVSLAGISAASAHKTSIKKSASCCSECKAGSCECAAGACTCSK